MKVDFLFFRDLRGHGGSLKGLIKLKLNIIDLSREWAPTDVALQPALRVEADALRFLGAQGLQLGDLLLVVRVGRDDGDVRTTWHPDPDRSINNGSLSPPLELEPAESEISSILIAFLLESQSKN